MRLAVALVAASAALFASDVLAGPRRVRPFPKASPSATVGPSPAPIVLRTPVSPSVLVRAGTFTMGSNDIEVAHAFNLCKLEPGGTDEETCRERAFAAEMAAHEVYLDDFWIDRTEVTVAEYAQCVSAGRCTAPPFGAGGERYSRPNLPVVLVTYGDATAFCTWAGGRLPTEAEWERAARGGSGRRYPWGNVYNPFLSNHGRLAIDETDDRDGFVELAPVGSFPEGRTPDGIDDLAGNVEEWVFDWYAEGYAEVSAVNPRGPDEGDLRVVRGGSFLRGRPWLRGSARMYEAPGARRPWVGFRCVRSR